MPQHVVVVDYQPQWPEEFLKESKYIQTILGDNCVAIYHIGSTSVPGLAAKPIIDMMPLVKDLTLVDGQAFAFEEIGYEYLGEFGIKGRRYLRKGGDVRTHQIHIFEQSDTYNTSRHLAFRNYLRTHEKEREEYARLKKSLAEKFPYDIQSYCDGKDAFIKELEKKALVEFVKEK